MENESRESRADAWDRRCRKLAYLPIITTLAALAGAGVSECADRVSLNREIRGIYRMEYETCEVPGGLERAREAFRKAERDDWNFNRQGRMGTLRRKIEEMEHDRPSREMQCRIIMQMKRMRKPGF